MAKEERMTLETVRDVFAWCLLINLVLLVFWYLMFKLAHDWIFRFHGKWFKLSPEAFDTTHYAGMGLFKIGILLFNLAPYFALRIVG
jgi:hypothetical protein